jgi:hypothetical protein
VRRLAEFAGDWLLERSITDHRADEVGTFNGSATLIDGADGWVWSEAGQLSMAGRKPFSATRRFRWAEPVPGRIRISFDDGRRFHDIAATAHHDCPPDSYNVAYHFQNWPVWTAVWRVTGPRKDYVMTTQHRRPD